MSRANGRKDDTIDIEFGLENPREPPQATVCERRSERSHQTEAMSPVASQPHQPSWSFSTQRVRNDEWACSWAQEQRAHNSLAAAARRAPCLLTDCNNRQPGAQLPIARPSAAVKTATSARLTSHRRQALTTDAEATAAMVGFNPVGRERWMGLLPGPGAESPQQPCDCCERGENKEGWRIFLGAKIRYTPSSAGIEYSASDTQQGD
ncbi:hypothetical protein SISNIDRAFT_470071 [Sistotremastrum niveocremeum HHB9708]|uniref:Uncharacterized protein n=1 Tax=Sistotremastrum niveocremeum HHB9708 TaxID=1314777 RepID=A0A164PDQ6_9AGAM|nr:hypothetical protein SISNIDRAFT_470071 [Sistotremastrum niveocremeum HHB9708]